jgi:hypothetical protein
MHKIYAYFYVYFEIGLIYLWISIILVLNRLSDDGFEYICTIIMLKDEFKSVGGEHIKK